MLDSRWLNRPDRTSYERISCFSEEYSMIIADHLSLEHINPVKVGMIMIDDKSKTREYNHNEVNSRKNKLQKEN